MSRAGLFEDKSSRPNAGEAFTHERSVVDGVGNGTTLALPLADIGRAAAGCGERSPDRKGSGRFFR
jgi:hypothetical protein